MDLNKDNKDIYTVDRESYSKYMKDNWKEPSDWLSSVIRFLLLLLLIVLAYFFYKIVKADLSFSDVFNKKELLSTYASFNVNSTPKYVEKEDYVEVLAKKIPIVSTPQVPDEKVKVVKIREMAHAEEVSDNGSLSAEYLNDMIAEMNSL